MKHKGVMSSGKPFANSFLSGDTPWCQVGWETIRKQFPVVMKHKGVMSDKKPFANRFLSA